MDLAQKQKVKPILVFQFGELYNAAMTLYYSNEEQKWTDDYSYVHTILNQFSRTALFVDEDETTELRYYAVFQDLNDIFTEGWERNDSKEILLNKIRKKPQFCNVFEMYKKHGIRYKLRAYLTIQDFGVMFNVRQISSSPQFETCK